MTRGLAVDALGFGVRPEAEALQAANSVVLDLDRAIIGNFGAQFFIVTKTLH